MSQELKGGYMNTTLKIFEDGKPTNALVIRTYVQGLFVPFACVGSSDPVRVLRLYTTNTLDTLWSIYCWDICTTCRYRIYVLLAQALRIWDFLLLIHTLLKYLAECALTLYCVVAYICACVDASRTVFWDRSYGGLGEKVERLDNVCPLRRPFLYDLFVQNHKVLLDRHWSNYAGKAPRRNY